MATFTPPADDTVPPVLARRHPGNVLMRYYAPRPEGRNVYMLTDGTITEADPDGTTVTWDDVATVWWGGHEAVEVTAAQAAALTAAGYTVT